MQRPSIDLFEIDPINDPRWAALAGSHPRASLFHSPKWLKALQMAYGFKSIAISTCAPGSELSDGLVYCQVNSWLTGRRLVSLPFSDHCDPLVEHPADADRMLRYLERYVDEGRWKHIEIRPVSFEPSSNTTIERSSVYYFHRINLRPSLDDLRRNCHKDGVQRKVRRAEREGLKYEEGRSSELLKKFYGLLLMTRRRHHLPPQPLEWFRSLIVAFGNDLKIRVLSKDEVAVASILTLSNNKTMVYKYGCSNQAFHNLGGMPFLLWRTIQEAKESGFEELDLGRSDHDNQGLIEFKDRLGGVRTLLNYWTYPHREAESRAGFKKKFADKIISIMPNLSLETVGKLLYKHFG